MKSIAVYSFKGGVGKTATAVTLASLAARHGRSTLVWDLDPQGAASFTFRMSPRKHGTLRRLVRGKGELADAIRATDFEHLDLVPADFSNRHLDRALDQLEEPESRIGELLEPLGDEYEVVLLDCAPAVSLASESIFAAADALLIPTIPTPLSLRTLARLLLHLKKRRPRPRVLPFFALVDRRKKLHREVIAYAQEHDLGFLATEIPYSSAAERMAVRRAPLPAFAPRDRATRAYEALWEELEDRLATKPHKLRRKSIDGLARRQVTRPGGRPQSPA